MSDPVVPVVPTIPSKPARLFPFRNEFRDNKEGAALRERFLPAAFGIELPELTTEQIAAIPKGWIAIKNADRKIVGACYPNVIYSDDKSQNLIRETFKIELTPEQKLAALEAEEARELEALMARMKAKKQAVLDAAKAAADPLIAAVAERAARPAV